jgi:hypothetical protein
VLLLARNGQKRNGPDDLIASSEQPGKKVTATTEIVNNTWRVVCRFYLRLVIGNLTFAIAE